MTHLNIIQKAANRSLQLENTTSLTLNRLWKNYLTDSEKNPLKYKNKISNIGKWNFHSTIFQVTNPPPPPQKKKSLHPHFWLRGSHLHIIQTATIWSLERETLKDFEIKRIWKNYQNIRITLQYQMGLSFYYIPSSQPSPSSPQVRHSEAHQ